MAGVVCVMRGSSVVIGVRAALSLMLCISLMLNIRLLLMKIVGVVAMVLFHVQSIWPLSGAVHVRITCQA